VYYHVESRVLGSALRRRAKSKASIFIHLWFPSIWKQCVFVCAYASCTRVTDAEQPPNDWWFWKGLSPSETEQFRCTTSEIIQPVDSTRLKWYGPILFFYLGWNGQYDMRLPLRICQNSNWSCGFLRTCYTTPFQVVSFSKKISKVPAAPYLLSYHVAPYSAHIPADSTTFEQSLVVPPHIGAEGKTSWPERPMTFSRHQEPDKTGVASWAAGPCQYCVKPFNP